MRIEFLEPAKKELDFCKMAIGPIFFKEILFFDFLEEST